MIFSSECKIFILFLFTLFVGDGHFEEEKKISVNLRFVD